MKNILLVDDDLGICHAMRDLCDMLSIDSFEYAHSLGEVSKMNLNKFDLAIVDLQLGQGSNGLDCLAFMRAHDFKGKAVFFSGHMKDHPLVKQARSVPEVAILTKPADLKVIEKILKS